MSQMLRGNGDHKESEGLKIKKLKILTPNTINRNAKIPATINKQAKNSLMSVADGDWWRINNIDMNEEQSTFQKADENITINLG